MTEPVPSLPPSVTSSPLYNRDLAPSLPEQRTWGTWDIAALWIGMAVCIPTYRLAADMISGGMTWWQATLTVLLGNVIVLFPMILNAVPGTKYGIPFPVLIRASFGTRGSNVPALMRGIVACGWFGIQTWIGGFAIYTLFLALTGKQPPAPNTADLPILGITGGELLCFMLFWAVNLYFIINGMNSIKWLEKISAPFLIAMGLAMLAWAWMKVGTEELFAPNLKVEDAPGFSKIFVSSLTGVVAFWATLSLNIPDFSRYAKNQKAQIWGQTIGLPPTMTLYAFIGIMVTSATVVIFGEAVWDPVTLFQKLDAASIVVLAMIGLTVATLSTNIAANVVSPANDLANLAPRLISFRSGGIITAIIGILMFPWKLYEDPRAYIFTWLLGYSALLGPIAGIMIADYFIRRKQILFVEDLYLERGRYTYSGGFNLTALIVLFVCVAPNVPGFLNYIMANDPFPEFFTNTYNFAWFVGFVLALVLYPIAMNLTHPGESPHPADV
ncbi:NCS1 family nucleobase:cation symporter-1 [Candidatus Poribacteria bacterium]|nr:NCS1 family nucleobase:cation symporter-1 [Candidatus Poribacteria bacterium]